MMLENKPLFIEYDLKDMTSRRTFVQGKDVFKNGQVISVSLQGTTITGNIKESETDNYQTSIHTENGKLSSNCTCPTSWEPICKHAIALGLAYLDKVNKINLSNEKSDLPDLQTEVIPEENLFLKSISNTIKTYEKYKEKTAFILHIDAISKRFSIFFYDKETKEIIHSPDWYISEKEIEKRLLQPERTFIEYFIQQETVKFFIPSRYYPIEKYLYTLPTIFKNIKFYNKDNGKVINFSQAELKLALDISLEEMQYLKIKPFWYNQNIKMDLKTGLHIMGIKSFVFHDNTFYPIAQSFHEQIAFQLLYNKNTEFFSNEIPQILLEIIPGLKNRGVKINKDKNLKNISIINEDPTPILKLHSQQDSLKAELYFDYDKRELPCDPNFAGKYFYVHDQAKPTYIVRNIQKEHKCSQTLIKNGFEYEGNNTFHSYQEKALDFINETVSTLKKEWTIENVDLSKHTISRNKIRLAIECNARKNSANFNLSFVLKAGKKEVDYNIIKKHIKEKKKYYQIGNSFAKIDAEEINLLISTLKKLDAKKVSDNSYKLPLYQGYYIYNRFKKNITSNNVFTGFIDNLNNFESIKKSDYPVQLQDILRDYQKTGYNWLYFLKENKLSGILADDMGLGKTIQTLSLLTQEYITNKTGLKSIIIAPTSTIFNWENEFKKFAPQLKTCIYTGNNRKSLIGKFKNYDIVLTSYAIIRKDQKEILSEKFHYCILDESQYIKNHRSQTAKTIKKINTSHRLALTGTPIENNLSELWSIFDFLMPKYLFSYETFKNTYDINGDIDTSNSNINALQKRVNPFILRRLKENVAKELPPKVESNLYCELSDEQKEIYEQYLSSLRNDIFKKVNKEGIAKNQISILSALMKLRQICCHPKLIKDPDTSHGRIKSAKFEYFKEILSEIISENHKVLVFSQFVEMLDIMKFWMEKHNIPYEYLTGSTKDRKACVDNFNNNPDIPVFLISLKAGGVGLNLTGADYVIHFDPWWNPAIQAQATDRTYRIGQTKKIFSYKMIAKDTIEEKILQLHEKKKNLINSVITSENGFSKSLSKKDLEYLLSF